jgi:hydroxyacylglutathione hydrolase
VTDPKGHVAALIAHRKEREEQILACIRQGVGRIPDMVKIIYREVPATLHGAAGFSVLAHLIQMTAEGRVRCGGEPRLGALYTA